MTAPIKEILSPEVFYVWVIGLTMAMLYLKGQNTAMIGIIGLLLGVAFLPALPEDMYGMGIIMLAVAIAAIVWRAFKSYE